jgi:hypothetical protein
LKNTFENNKLFLKKAAIRGRPFMGFGHPLAPEKIKKQLLTTHAAALDAKGSELQRLRTEQTAHATSLKATQAELEEGHLLDRKALGLHLANLKRSHTRGSRAHLCSSASAVGLTRFVMKWSDSPRLISERSRTH